MLKRRIIAIEDAEMMRPVRPACYDRTLNVGLMIIFLDSGQF